MPGCLIIIIGSLCYLIHKDNLQPESVNKTWADLKKSENQPKTWRQK